MAEAKKPFHETVAEKLIRQLQAGTAPWQKPWVPGAPGSYLPTNPATGKRYKGINAINLLAEGRTDVRWMTYRQAESAGAQVRRGERGTAVQYWKFTDEETMRDAAGKPVVDADGKVVKITVELERPRVFFATVFNAEQIDGLPPLVHTPPAWNPIERADGILSASGAVIRHGEHDGAFYRPWTDSIHMPDRNQFASADRYYATALHELGHWTGHPSRLDRDLSNPFGSDGYAREELRAEIASMILGDELGIGHDPGQHAAYVASWIAILQQEPMEIFRAAADAERIHGFVLGLEQQQTHEREHVMVTPTAGEDRDEQPVQGVQAAVETPGQRTYLDVPFREKDQAKALGARWDRREQSWYVPAGVDVGPFAQWSKAPGSAEVESTADELRPAKTERTYLAVPYGERQAAKAAGALWDKTAKSWYAGPKADLDRLQRWLPERAAGEQAPAMSPREEFAKALEALGCIVSDNHPIMDGQTHRIAAEGDSHGETAGFYVGHLDGHPAGYIKNNRTGIDMRWKAKGYALNEGQKAALNAEAAAKLADRNAERDQAQEATAVRVAGQTKTLKPVDEPTPYMRAKGLRAHAGALTDSEGKTYLPIIDVTGKQWSMQYISEAGVKRFAKNSRKDGCFHIVGGTLADLAQAPALVIGEGYATAATLAEGLGQSTVAAFDAGNLLEVARALHAAYPDKPVIIAGDDDRHNVLTLGTNPGREHAEAAAKAVGGIAVFPVFAPGEAQYPEDLARFTPEQYREHQQAQKALKDVPPDAPAAQITALKAALLSTEQQAAINRLRQHSDFNDLAMRSALGMPGVERQVRPVLARAVEQAALKRQQQQVQTQHRSTRIG